MLYNKLAIFNRLLLHIHPLDVKHMNRWSRDFQTSPRRKPFEENKRYRKTRVSLSYTCTLINRMDGATEQTRY